MESIPPNPYSSPAADLYGSAASAPENGGISPATLALLAGTKPWVRFMSVMLWIGIVFMLGMALLMGGIMLAGIPGSGLDKGPMGAVGVIVMVGMYSLLAFLYVYPAIKLWAYASRIAQLSATRTITDLDAALNEQRRFWKFVGVLTITLICLYVVAAVAIGVAVGMGAMGAMKAGNFPMPPQP